MTSVLLVEPYFAGSHRAWAEGYAGASRHSVEVLSLPGRFWKWRMFGGSLTLAHQTREVDVPDVVLASDMLDLAAFLGHCDPRFGSVRTVLYMHENQLTYPLSPTARDDLAYAYMNWSSMVRADEVWFNSQFHRDAVFEALPKFLRHFPDHRHTSLVDAVVAKSRVMPVGVDLSWADGSVKRDPPLVVWNQRWEYDKDPVRLFDALYRLAADGAGFEIALCGENFRNSPAEFEEAKSNLADQIVQFGYADLPTYRRLLNDSSVVVSTAKHEFFGVGAVEAMAAGAAPVFPSGLSYPELLPVSVHDRTLYRTDDDLDSLLAAAVSDKAHRTEITEIVREEMRRFSWAVVGPMYDEGLS